MEEKNTHTNPCDRFAGRQRVELSCHTAHDHDVTGMISPSELMTFCDDHDISTVAVTDRNKIYSFRKFERIQNNGKHQTRVLYGMELDIADDIHPEYFMASKKGEDPDETLMYGRVTVIVQNQEGLDNLVDIVGSLTNLTMRDRFPKIKLSEFLKKRNGLLVGSGILSSCFLSASGYHYGGILEEKWKELAQYVDYLMVVPCAPTSLGLVSPYQEAWAQGYAREMAELAVRLGEENHLPVVAVSVAEYLRPTDCFTQIEWKRAKGEEFAVGWGDYLRTPAEMWREFDYLSEDVREEIIFDNPQRIADRCEPIQHVGVTTIEAPNRNNFQ